MSLTYIGCKIYKSTRFGDIESFRTLHSIMNHVTALGSLIAFPRKRYCFVDKSYHITYSVSPVKCMSNYTTYYTEILQALTIFHQQPQTAHYSS